jgi:hypothetical protein
MPAYPDEKRLVIAIRSRFPDAAALTDRWLMERGSERSELDDNPWSWIEAFADRTGELVKERDAGGVQQHTDFFAERYRAGPDATRRIIDVAYAENMMWNAKAADKVWAWRFIAKEMRQLYEQMWGAPGK